MNEMNLSQILFSGGPMMIPIIICSIFMLSVIISKWMYLANISTNIIRLKVEIFELVRNNKIKQAIIVCEDNNSPTGQILKAGLLKFGSPREEIKEEMEYTGSLEIPKLESGLAPLITIANISPLLGMLGTILGMIVMFHNIQVKSSSLSPLTPADLTGGIWQALLTTLAGIMVAIPAFTAYNYFVHRVNSIITETEQATSELIKLLTRLTESNNSTVSEMLE